MSDLIEVRYDVSRGCGDRKPGGTYLVGDPPSAPCGKLPLALAKVCACPDCGHLIYTKTVDDKRVKHSRAPRMLKNPTKLWRGIACSRTVARQQDLLHDFCPMAEHNADQVENALLIWISKDHYKTPDEFLKEAGKLGISRRLTRGVPPTFKLGRTWVLLAHLKAIELEKPSVADPPVTHLPAIFSLFKPTAIEYVVEGNETEEELQEMRLRGITPVKIEQTPPDWECKICGRICKHDHRPSGETGYCTDCLYKATAFFSEDWDKLLERELKRARTYFNLQLLEEARSDAYKWAEAFPKKSGDRQAVESILAKINYTIEEWKKTYVKQQ